MAPSNKRSICSALAVLGIEDISVFDEAAGDIELEFKIVKKAHSNRALILHPDKGGDPEKFREMRSCFELLRDLYVEKTIGSFSQYLGGASSNAENVEYDTRGDDFEFQSWEYYQEAADTPVPIYHMEPAKSGRSQCAKCKRKIPDVPIEEQLINQGAVRIGSIDNESGTYGRWCHLKCWRKLIYGSSIPENSVSRTDVSTYRCSHAHLVGLAGPVRMSRSQVLRCCTT